jgi:hypothetical protein
MYYMHVVMYGLHQYLKYVKINNIFQFIKNLAVSPSDVCVP